MKLFSICKHKIKRAIYGPYASGEDLIAYLRSKGMRIGSNTIIHDVKDVFIDPSRPWMIRIGDNVQIARGVTILTHGYDWSVIKGLYGDVLGSAGHVYIGNNVFIGMQATILKGVTIGDNVIIGANSLINKDVPSGVIVAGNPQRILCDIGSYRIKRLSVQLDEAFDLYSCWRSNSKEGLEGGAPPKTIFHEFFWLFEDSETAMDDPVFAEVMNLGGNCEMSIGAMRAFRRQFSCYEDFIAYLDSRLRSEKGRR